MKLIIILILLINYSAVTSEWRQVHYVQFQYIQSINCIDSNNCFVFLNDYSVVENASWSIYKSNDIGKTWELLYSAPNVKDQEEPQVLNIDDGLTPQLSYIFVISDDNPIIVKSSDSGKTFKKIVLQENASGTDKKLRSFAMYDENYGFVTNGYHYFTTTDGWETFVRHPKLHTNQTYYSPVFLDSNTVGMIYSSPWANGMGLGVSYVKYYLDKNSWDTVSYFGKKPGVGVDYIYSIYFVNDTLGFACGRQSDTSLPNGNYYDLLYKTIDGGNNWYIVHKDYIYPQIGFINNIAFADEKNGIAVGFYGKIAMTNDGGDTWVYEPTPNTMSKCRKMLVTWAGHTPLIGTWDAGIFRYEGDFFKFPVSVEEKPEEQAISIYPNPAGDYLYLHGGKGYEKIEIFSILGVQVFESDYKDKIEISQLSPGMYILRIGGKIIKFIKY